MTPRENWACVPMLVMVLLGIAIILPPVIGPAEGALTPAVDEVTKVAPRPWAYLDGRHGAPEASTGLIWDRAQGKWRWVFSEAYLVEVVMFIVRDGTPRALVFAGDYLSGRSGPPMAACQSIAERYTRDGQPATCIWTADE